MNINRDYLIINDVKKSNIKLDNGSMFFYITDKNTQNIFVNLVIDISNNDLIQKFANIENAEDYTLTMNILKPSNTYKIIEGKLHDKENAIFEFNLNEDCCDEIGTYRCELLTKCTINGHEEITTSNKLTYKVKSSVLNDLDDIVEAPEYPLVIQLFDKLSDIDQYEEDRRANELARQLAEEQRQTRFNTLDADMVNRVNAMDSKMDDVEARISAKEQAVDKLIVDTKADIDDYKVAKDQEIDEYKVAKDTEINNAITTQDNKINEFINERNDRLNAIGAKNIEQDNRLDVAENRLANIGNDITNTMQPIIDAHTSRLDAIEAIDVSQNNRLDAIEAKNQQQDDRLLDVEKVNNRQDIDIKCLYGASQTIDVTKEGNSIYLQNSNNGFAIIDEIKGNTLVNCNKEPDKEIILNGNINTQGYSNITLTEGVDGGLVDVALEGNTMVNVCNQKDPIAITKSYTVETGNHVALQGEYDGKCRPVVTGNTLWIDNDTEDVLTAFDESKNLRLQSSFEDKVVTQEMVDAGEELAENLGKYKVEYVISKEDGTVGQTKTFYLNSPLLEGDTIEQQGNNVVHVHRSEIRAYQTDDELTLPTDMTNTLVAKASPQYEIISQNDTILCDSYVNGHLDVDSVVPIKKVEFKNYGKNLKYIYPSTDYILQFESDNVGILNRLRITKANVLNNVNIVKGTNKINFTTGTNNSPWLELTGIGFNASNIVVTEATDQEFGYFEGMKSVGECEDLEVVSSNSDGTQSNTQTLTHEPLRAVGDAKDRYVLIDGKWYIERNCLEKTINELYNLARTKQLNTYDTCNDIRLFTDNLGIKGGKNPQLYSDFKYVNRVGVIGEAVAVTAPGTDTFIFNVSKEINSKDRFLEVYGNGKCIFQLATPTYEPIDYNPFTVYSDTTHISNNSTIPCNMTIKNTGYNCLLKPNTTYTVSSNLGLNVVTTPSVLDEDCLRFYDTDTSTVTTMKDVMVLEGDYTTGKPLPSHFSGIESTFEQEYDEEKGKYKVRAKVVGKNLFGGLEFINTQSNKYSWYKMTNLEKGKTYTFTASEKVGNNTVLLSCLPKYSNGNYITVFNKNTDKIRTIKNPYDGNSCYIGFYNDTSETTKMIQIEQGTEATPYEPYKENYIEFYIDEPLRGIGNTKDKVYVKDDKVVVERNCGQREYQDGDFGTYLTDKVNTVYQLAEPTYEEVEYNDVKLFIESFKNSTLSYNSNVPVTSKVHYSYSVPIVDTVAQTADISDQQDSMIIDLATQVSVMEMMLM